MKFFQVPPSQAADYLNSDLLEGLNSEQVLQKREVIGWNVAPSHRNRSFFACFLSRFHDYMVVILLIAALVSAIVSVFEKNLLGLFNSLVIVAIVILNALIGTFQIYKSEETMISLEKYTNPLVKVLRDARVMAVKREELVVGDIVLLETGDLVPADGRIVESLFLRVDEHNVTGVTLPAEKSNVIIEGDNHSAFEMVNMVFSETLVISGSAKIIVTAIGAETQAAKLFVDRNKEQEKTPLQMQMMQMGKVLSLGALIICALIFVLGIIEGKAVINMFLVSVSLAVAAVPEGLTATVTIMLSIGAKLLSKHGIVVRKLSAVESLGNIDVVCTGKTGILMQNKMSVTECFVGGEQKLFKAENYRSVAELILYGSMCNEACDVTDNKSPFNFCDPTEKAIVSALGALGKDKSFLDAQFPRLGLIPFDTERKCKSSIHVINGRIVLITKGAPEVVLAKCQNSDFLEAARKAELDMAQKGQRVLAVAVKELSEIPSDLFADEMERELHLVGLIGMIGVTQSQTMKSISDCRNAGIRPIIFTGEHAVSARAMAEQIGVFGNEDILISGEVLENMSTEEFLDSIDHCSVYSRLSSTQKQMVVETLQKKGKTVAVIGDSIEDVSALQAATVGCSVRDKESDIVYKSSDIIILENGFGSAVSAIRFCRGVYNNIKKTIRFLLAGSVGEVLIILISILCLFNSPLLPLHLLWINVVINTMLSLSLGMETARQGLMARPPRSKKAALITRKVACDIFWQGVLIAGTCILGFLIGTDFHPSTKNVFLNMNGQTMAFVVLAFSLIIHAYDQRSKHLLLKIGVFTNKYLNIAAIFSVILMLTIVVLPGVRDVFGVVPLSFAQWLIAFGLSFVPFAICEFIKLFRK